MDWDKHRKIGSCFLFRGAVALTQKKISIASRAYFQQWPRQQKNGLLAWPQNFLRRWSGKFFVNFNEMETARWLHTLSKLPKPGCFTNPKGKPIFHWKWPLSGAQHFRRQNKTLGGLKIPCRCTINGCLVKAHQHRTKKSKTKANGQDFEHTFCLHPTYASLHDCLNSKFILHVSNCWVHTDAKKPPSFEECTRHWHIQRTVGEIKREKKWPRKHFNI